MAPMCRTKAAIGTRSPILTRPGQNSTKRGRFASLFLQLVHDCRPLPLWANALLRLAAQHWQSGRARVARRCPHGQRWLAIRQPDRRPSGQATLRAACLTGTGLLSQSSWPGEEAARTTDVIFRPPPARRSAACEITPAGSRSKSATLSVKAVFLAVSLRRERKKAVDRFRGHECAPHRTYLSSSDAPNHSVGPFG